MKYLKIVFLIALFVPMAAAAPVWLQIVFLAGLVMALAGPTRKLPWYMNLSGSVTVSEANGQLGGTITVQDGVVGMVLTGVTEGGGYTLGTPILVTSLTDVATAGITVTNNPFAMQKLTDFYNEAPLGSQLYLMLTANTITIANMADGTNANGAVKLLNFASGAIKVLGLCADDKAIHTAGGTITVTNGINADVSTAAASLKTMEATYRALCKPFRGVIGGSSYSGTASALTDESSGTTNNKCAILIGDSQNYDATYSSAAIGLLLGRIANNPVNVKISRVKDGPVAASEIYLHTTTLESAGGDPATIAGKNYITFKNITTRTGYYFSGDPMLTVSTDDYSFLARCRVIDKAHVIAYNVGVNELDDDVPTIAGGLPDPGWCKWFERQFINQIELTMVANKECSAVDCFVDPAQNVVSTNTLAVVLKIRPKGYLTFINIQLGFEL